VLTYVASKVKEPDRLFDYALVVGLETDEDCHRCVVHVLFHCPEQVRSVLFNNMSIWHVFSFQ